MPSIEEKIEWIARKFAENNGEPAQWREYVTICEEWVTAVGDAGYEIVEQE